MRDLMPLVASAARHQGFTVSSAPDHSRWTFQKNGQTAWFPAPKRPVDYMEIRARLTGMGMTWPFR